MNRAVSMMIVLVAGCGGDGKRVAAPSPSTWCYGCDGTTVYAPGETFLIMTEWDATCTGGFMRADDQVHPCDAQAHKDQLTCTRDGGGGDCAVAVTSKETLTAQPKQPGTYRIAVTMQPAHGPPYQQELGRVVIDVPDEYDVTCTRPPITDTIDLRVSVRRGTVPVLGPRPTVTIGGLACQPPPDADHFLDFYDLECSHAPAAQTTFELAIASPVLSKGHTVTCPAAAPDPIE